MNYLLEVCLVAITLTAGITPIAAQPPQAMQKGISVELALTSNAAPMPGADQEDASIVSVTADGSVYFGVNPISPAALSEKLKSGLSDRIGKELYIKADARTQYANVMSVLDAVRAAGLRAPNLLTAQQGSSEQGNLVPPKGLQVSAGPSLTSGSEAIVVEVLNSSQQWPELKINSEHVSWASLQGTLRQLLQSQREQLVLVKAEGLLPFGHVVHVVDICRSTGAKISLATPGL
jgi:biopolymer transport protein ExbD